jgi:hypothetical protein
LLCTRPPNSHIKAGHERIPTYAEQAEEAAAQVKPNLRTGLTPAHAAASARKQQQRKANEFGITSSIANMMYAPAPTLPPPPPPQPVAPPPAAAALPDVQPTKAGRRANKPPSAKPN